MYHGIDIPTLSPGGGWAWQGEGSIMGRKGWVCQREGAGIPEGEGGYARGYVSWDRYTHPFPRPGGGRAWQGEGSIIGTKGWVCQREGGYARGGYVSWDRYTHLLPQICREGGGYASWDRYTQPQYNIIRTIDKREVRIVLECFLVIINNVKA